MSKKVIVIDGDHRVYRTLEDASKELGIGPGSLSMAISEGRSVGGRKARWAERVFAVRVRNEGWRICVRDSRGRFVIDGDLEKRVRQRDVDQVKELTGVWYF